MRLLLEIDTVGSMHYSFSQQRQQITPDIRFTCNGLITKWIIGSNVSLPIHPVWTEYPELQVWRSTGINTYRKINGTFIEITSLNSNRIYEYDNFSPIPFQAGDILGTFLPTSSLSRLPLSSEFCRNPSCPTNYYREVGIFDSESPYDTIDLANAPPVMSQEHYPMVSVEIGEFEYLKRSG